MTALVTTVLVALVAAGASLYTGRVLPRLERRVRDHTALLKDMPADIAEPLRDLLEDEVKQLVARERRRPAPLTQRAARWNRAVVITGILGALFVFVSVGVRIMTVPTPGVPTWLVVTSFGLAALAALMAIVNLVNILWPDLLRPGPPEPHDGSSARP